MVLKGLKDQILTKAHNVKQALWCPYQTSMEGSYKVRPYLPGISWGEKNPPSNVHKRLLIPGKENADWEDGAWAGKKRMKIPLSRIL